MTYVSSVSAYLVAHPEVAAALSLVAALVVNWALGTIDALVRGDFSLDHWPRIIRSQLASVYVVAIASSYGAGIAAAVATAYLGNHGLIDAQLVKVIVAAFLGVASSASALYSVKLWNECRVQLLDVVEAIVARLSSTTPAARKNLPTSTPPATVHTITHVINAPAVATNT